MKTLVRLGICKSNIPVEIGWHRRNRNENKTVAEIRWKAQLPIAWDYTA